MDTDWTGLGVLGSVEKLELSVLLFSEVLCWELVGEGRCCVLIGEMVGDLDL